MNSKVIKFVAGGGKTTAAIDILKNKGNGLYIAFTKRVVLDVSMMGYLSKTIDSLFLSFIIPKFTSLLPIIKSGSKVKYIASGNLRNDLKGAAKISFDMDGSIFNRKSKIGVSLNTENDELHSMQRFPNSKFLKYIFGDGELRITQQQLDDLSKYIIHNFPEQVIEILSSRFSYIIIDEAQDLKGYREDFAKLLFNSNIELILFGDENQNINGGGKWFEELSPDERRNRSFRCPEGNCKWIRKHLGIEIYGNNVVGSYYTVNLSTIMEYDDGERYLLYNAKSVLVREIVENWNGPKGTIKTTKGDTIDSDIVIVGKTLNKMNHYTAITRTKRNVYSTIAKK